MLDPEVLNFHEEVLDIKIPERGTPVLAKNRGGNVVAGQVGEVHLSQGTLCIDIETIGGTARIYPELGDKFKTWEQI